MTAAPRLGGGYATDAAAPTNITTTSTTTILTGPGVLEAIVFNNPVATGVVTIYDNTAGSGTKIGTITVPASPQPFRLEYHAQFTVGLTIVVATAAQDLTVLVKP